jgi:hypothetical protein
MVAWLICWLAFIVTRCAGRSSNPIISMTYGAKHVEFGSTGTPTPASLSPSVKTTHCYFDTSKKCSQSTDGNCVIDSRPCNSNRSYLNSIYKKQRSSISMYETIQPSSKPVNSKATNNKNQVNSVNEILQGYNIYNFNEKNSADRSNNDENNNKQLKKTVEMYQDHSSTTSSSDSDGPRSPWLASTRPAFYFVSQLLYLIHNSLKVSCFAIFKYIRNLQNRDTSSNM